MPSITNPHLSSKHLIIKKDNAAILIAVAIAIFLLFFSFFVSRALLSQASYNQSVISKKNEALVVAEANRSSALELEASYISFATEIVNILGGNPTGTGPIDGTNPKLILDSLPSVNDYPALSSSIEKLLIDNSYQIERIGGSESDIFTSQITEGIDTSTESSIVEIPYPLSIVSTVEGTKNLLEILERSIRPFYVEGLSLSGSDESMSARITMKTFYQPKKTFTLTEVLVK